MMLTALRATPLKVGDQAPDVTGITQDGQALKLGDLYPKGYTLVYFFPRAFTSGCTAEGCSLRDAFADLKAQNLTVIGVSTDTVEKQKEFKEHYEFPFTLLADPGKKVMTAFGVNTYRGTNMAQRQSFLIDRSGKIVWCDYKASTAQQAHDVLAALKKLQG